MAEKKVKSFSEFVEDTKKLIGLPVVDGVSAATTLFSNDPADHQVWRTTADLGLSANHVTLSAMRILYTLTPRMGVTQDGGRL